MFVLLLAACAGPSLAPPGTVFDPSVLYPAPPSPVQDLLSKESLTLDDFLHVVDRLNPTLAAGRQRIDIAAAEAFDAGLYPNPALVLDVEEARPKESFNHSKRTFGLEQEFSITGKYGAARDVKEKEREKHIQEYRLLRRMVLLEAKQAFLDYLAAQANLELRVKVRDNAKTINDLTQAKFEARAAPEIQVLKSSVRLAIAEADVKAAQKHVAVTLKSLHTYMGNFDLSTNDFRGQLGTEYEAMSLEALRGAILQNHPRLEIARRQKEAAHLELEWARADAWPNITAGIRGGFDEEDAFILEGGLAIPLPIVNRNQGKKLAAELKIREAEFLIESERNAVLLELAQAHTTMVSAQERVKTYLEEVLPKARKGLEQAETGFRAGEFSQLDVLDAQATLSESGAAYLAALEDLNRAATELEKLTGTRLRVVK